MDTGLYRCNNPRTIWCKVPVTDEKLQVLRRIKTYDKDNNLRISSKPHYVSRMSVRCPVVVPCNECPACRLRTQRQWQARITTEFSATVGNTYMSTLTFAPEHYPDLDNTETCKRMYSAFVREQLIPRLRAPRAGGMKFRYYCGCEFGDNQGRFHIHILLFLEQKWNNKFDGLGKPVLLHYRPKDTTKKPKKKARLQYQDEADLQFVLTKYWDYGFVEKTERADFGSAAYVTKYVTKVKEDKVADKCPFHRQSRGIGTQWLEEHKESIAKCDERLMPCSLLDADAKYFVPIPKYYKAKYSKEFGTYIDHCRDYIRNSFAICKKALMRPVVIDGVRYDDPIYKVYVRVPNSWKWYDTFDAYEKLDSWSNPNFEFETDIPHYTYMDLKLLDVMKHNVPIES